MTEIETIRADLKKAAAHQPALQPSIKVLDKQLRKLAKANGDDRKALYPEIEKSVAKIEKAVCGR